jgi:hypothetical protein
MPTPHSDISIRPSKDNSSKFFLSYERQPQESKQLNGSNFSFFLLYSLIGEDRNLLSAVRLSDYFNRPTIIEKGYNFDHLSRGLTTQSQEEVDPFFTSEVIIRYLDTLRQVIVRYLYHDNLYTLCS